MLSGDYQEYAIAIWIFGLVLLYFVGRLIAKCFRWVFKATELEEQSTAIAKQAKRTASIVSSIVADLQKLNNQLHSKQEKGNIQHK